MDGSSVSQTRTAPTRLCMCAGRARQPKVSSARSRYDDLCSLSAATVFSNDDCYLSEAAAIVDAIEGTGPRDAILSSYEDALESYKMVHLSCHVIARANS